MSDDHAPAPPASADTGAPPEPKKPGPRLLFGKGGRPIVIQPDPNPPSKTLYIRNLNEKKGHTTLRRHLMRLYEQYGLLLDVRCHRGVSKKGQAWVIFKRLNDAVVAYRDTQDRELLGKPMIVQYAKMKSRIAAEDEGTLEDYEAAHSKRFAERAKEGESKKVRRNPTGLPAAPFAGIPAPAFPPGFRPAAAQLPTGGLPGLPFGPGGVPALPPGVPLPPGMPLPPPGFMPPVGLPGAPAGAGAVGAPMGLPTATPAIPAPAGPGAPRPPAHASAMAAVPDELVPPNPVLFVSGLPPGSTQDAVHAAFARFEGLVEVRVVPARGVAFVEFANETFSAAAKREMDGQPLPGGDAEHPLKITFRK